MWTKQYGKTGKNVSVISFGGMRFSGDNDLETNAELLPYALERGINYFDTAPGYGDSEDIFGIAFRGMDRDSFYVATKAAQSKGKEVRKSLETSLKRMNIEKIDFFHIWCVVTLDAWKGRVKGGAVAAAMKAKEEGLVEHVVISSHLRGNELSDVLAEGPFEGVTLGYSAINFPYREQALKAAREMNLGVVTMNPLGGGLIPRNAKRFDFLRGPEDRSVVEAALRFNVSNPAVTSALVGFTTREHIDEAVEAVVSFQPYTPQRVEAMRGEVIEAFNDLCTGCGYCLPCPENVDIPRLMDGYNHMLLSESDPQALINRLKWHWSMNPGAAEACALCGECEERCTQHLPIGERMKEIAAVGKKKKKK